MLLLLLIVVVAAAAVAVAAAVATTTATTTTTITTTSGSDSTTVLSDTISAIAFAVLFLYQTLTPFFTVCSRPPARSRPPPPRGSCG